MPHTPGPWAIPDWHQLGRIDVVAGTVKVAAVYLQPDRDKRGWPTEEANARLIAAAPELLEALQDLSKWGRTYTSPLDPHSPHDLLIAAVEAIAKAIKEES